MSDQVKIDAHRPVGIIVIEAHEQRLLEDLYAEFFTQFAAKCRNALFSVFYFAAGEFPQAGE